MHIFYILLDINNNNNIIITLPHLIKYAHIQCIIIIIMVIQRLSVNLTL